MQSRAFLDLARDLVVAVSEVYWRAAAVHAYYALLLECRDAQGRWGFAVPPRQSVHAVVRLRFVYAGDPDLKRLGDALDQLVRLRNKASYALETSPTFSSAIQAQQAVRDATAALALLDAIDSDPVRRSAASGSIRP